MYPAWIHKPLRSSGYTLLELVAVLGILVLISATIPFVGGNWLTAHQFKEAKSDLLRAVSAARHAAMQQGASQVLTLETLVALGRVEKTEFLDYRLSIDGDIVFYPNGTGTTGNIILVGKKSEARVHIEGITGHIWIVDEAKR